MLHTWQWRLSRPHTGGATHWVWDDESKQITEYNGDAVSHRSYTCSLAREWFARHTDAWVYTTDPDLLMDEGL